MFKALLSVGARRLAAPLPLQIIQVIHAYHNLEGLVDDSMYIAMYLGIVIVLFIMEVSARKPLSGWPKAAFILLTAFTIGVGVTANGFVYWHTHLHVKDQAGYYASLALIVGVTLAFELTVKLVVHQIKAKALVIPTWADIQNYLTENS